MAPAQSVLPDRWPSGLAAPTRRRDPPSTATATTTLVPSAAVAPWFPVCPVGSLIEVKFPQVAPVEGSTALRVKVSPETGVFPESTVTTTWALAPLEIAVGTTDSETVS